MDFPRKRQTAAAAALLLVAGTLVCRRASSPAVPPQAGRIAARETPAPAELDIAPFTPAERAAVDDFIRHNPSLRVATDRDHVSSSEQETDFRNLYGVYHPYFVRGDLNDDGVLDFVLGFVRRDSSAGMPWFSLVVFTGGERSAGGPPFDPGTFLERDISLARGDLSIDRDAIVVTPDLEDESARRYRWDP
ncbi:MAG TPA: hypothetical protein VLO07_03500, partial [Thermoanaerobaculia bacterium]|nr:hypothetical protein [Thermoanaerobaculia bacterium]